MESPCSTLSSPLHSLSVSPAETLAALSRETDLERRHGGLCEKQQQQQQEKRGTRTTIEKKKSVKRLFSPLLFALSLLLSSMHNTTRALSLPLSFELPGGALQEASSSLQFLSRARFRSVASNKRLETARDVPKNKKLWPHSASSLKKVARRQMLLPAPLPSLLVAVPFLRLQTP